MHKYSENIEIQNKEQTKVYQGSHSILKLKIEENRGDSRRNFVKFEDNFEKNRGESRRFFLYFRTKSRKIEEIFQSQ